MTGRLTIVVSGKLSVLELPAGSRLRLLSGRVWLTEAGCARDIVLEAGMSHATQAAGKLLCEAQGEALLEVEAGRAAQVASPASGAGEALAALP
ncbi:MAG: DUF2917 domain-containing protein [Candidatus Dactylopiibacterium sp.]|nr:DUF2917 domain-containing protein [Candidatus Dactylopiibacterium sp.]